MSADLPRDPFELAEVRRMPLQPGDIVVVECDQLLTRSTIKDLQDYFAAHFAPHKVVVVSGGLHVSVVAPEDDPS